MSSSPETMPSKKEAEMVTDPKKERQAPPLFVAPLVVPGAQPEASVADGRERPEQTILRSPDLMKLFESRAVQDIVRSFKQKEAQDAQSEAVIPHTLSPEDTLQFFLERRNGAFKRELDQRQLPIEAVEQTMAQEHNRLFYEAISGVIGVQEVALLTRSAQPADATYAADLQTFANAIEAFNVMSQGQPRYSPGTEMAKIIAPLEVRPFSLPIPAAPVGSVPAPVPGDVPSPRD